MHFYLLNQILLITEWLYLWHKDLLRELRLILPAFCGWANQQNKMDSLEFTEIQTPIITASSPEGARDFVVPSNSEISVEPGKGCAGCKKSAAELMIASLSAISLAVLILRKK